MGLCGSFRCGCGVTSTPAVSGAINGSLPSILVAGSGESGDPYDLSLNDAWAAEVAAMARGQVAYATTTAATDGIAGTLVDMNGLSVTPTLVAGRLYRVSVRTVNEPSGTGFQITDILVGGAVVAQSLLSPASTASMGMLSSAVFTGSGATIVKVQQAIWAGTMNHRPTATNRAYILVEDIGLA
jgi:hypothetical protein